VFTRRATSLFHDQLYRVHIFKKIHFNIILLSTPETSKRWLGRSKESDQVRGPLLNFVTFHSLGTELAQSEKCLSTDWRTGVRSPIEAEDSSLCVQTSSGAHPASCTMGTGGPFPGGKVRQGRDADHLPPSSAVAENE
jgi:hypothetical protein